MSDSDSCGLCGRPATALIHGPGYCVVPSVEKIAEDLAGQAIEWIDSQRRMIGMDKDASNELE
jgi:hypothetical protein